jgi:magnesium-transporting ATPase (P-type)
MKKILVENDQKLRSLKNDQHIRNIFLDIFFSLITCGLFNIYIQYCQILAVNEMVGEERYSFLKWFIFCFFTLGLYHIYHEFVKGEEIGKIAGERNLGLICLILALCGLSIIADALQQNQINSIYGEKGP